MNEVMMVPLSEFERLSSYYQGQITEGALLKKAGRLAADRHLILRNKKIPDSMAVRMAKPLASEQSRLVKRIRTGTAAPAYEGIEEPEGMVDAPVETMLKKLIKGVNNPIVIDDDGEPISARKRVKKESQSPSPSIKREVVKPSTSKAKPSTSKVSIPKGLSPKSTKVLEDLGYREDGGYSPPTTKKYKTLKKYKKKSEAEKLAEGWEDWDYPTKTNLNYEEEDADDEEEEDSDY